MIFLLLACLVTRNTCARHLQMSFLHFSPHCAIKPGMDVNASYIETKYFCYHTFRGKAKPSNYRKKWHCAFHNLHRQ